MSYYTKEYIVENLKKSHNKATRIMNMTKNKQIIKYLNEIMVSIDDTIDYIGHRDEMDNQNWDNVK